MMPDGWTWDRRWFSLRRLMCDGEVIGEASLHNGTWYGTVGGRVLMSSSSLDTHGAAETVMGQVAEVAMRMN